MSDTNLKETLYNKLEEINDESLILSLLNHLEIEINENEILKYSKTQLRKIEESKQSVRVSGIPNKEVFKKSSEWLRK